MNMWEKKDGKENLAAEDDNVESMWGRHQKVAKPESNYCPPLVHDGVVVDVGGYHLVGGKDNLRRVADDEDNYQAN